MSRSPQVTERPRERVLVCGVLLPGQPTEHGGVLEEVRGLVAAAGGDVIGEGVTQRRERAHPATFMGRGKVEEIGELVELLGPDAVVVDNDLGPAQVRNLEKAWDARVVDRSELILDIFTRRAQTRQARLQVELAQTEYLLPRLRRMWTHLERQVGGIGTRGPGETQLETDKRLLQRRIRDLKRELKEIEERKKRQVRARKDQFTVGLVGYTNAGKSTLLNRLTGADELSADMLFATLDTRTRRWRLPDGRTVLLSDTVGFLQRLPHHLVASFHATLEEALNVDLLIHVVDSAHADAATQMGAVDEVLGSLSRGMRADLLVFNKVDRLGDRIELALLREGRAEEVVYLSAHTGEGIDGLIDVLVRNLDERSALVELVIPFVDGRTLASVRELGLVLSEECVQERGTIVRARIPDGALGNLRQRAGRDVDIVVQEAAQRPFLAGESVQS